jgi:spore germination cell wall hydrolase CwlJ-like protein
MLTSIGCLVAVMYFEARNQPVDTMLGVGQVLIEHVYLHGHDMV